METLAPGQLVVFFETKSRYYFALVRRVKNDSVTLGFLGGDPDISVSDRGQIQTLETFLQARKRVWSLSRQDLAYIFYNHAYVRLPQEKIAEIQKTLRKGGLRFSPDEWPHQDTRIQIQIDKSFVAASSSDSGLAALLPQWIEPFSLPSGSRDPLGFQAPAERLVNEVLPGLTVFTSRAGYYGFLPWAIRFVNGVPSSELPPKRTRRDILNALERGLALCEFVHHHPDDDCVLIGQRSRQRVLSSAENDRFRVPESILKNQNSAGSFRLFSTSLTSMGLVDDADDLAAEGHIPFRLTDLGNKLADAFGRRIDPTFGAFARGDRSRPRDEIRAWGKELCFSTIPKLQYFRQPLLRGFLLGNGREAEKRHATLTHLFERKLLDASIDVKRVTPVDATMSEAEAHVQEDDVASGGLSNIQCVLHFYGLPPTDKYRALQVLSVFELLSLGFSAVFRAVVAAVATSRVASLSTLCDAIFSTGPYVALRTSPLENAAFTGLEVAALVDAIFEAPSPSEGAAAGACLLAQVVRSPMFEFVAEDLRKQTPDVAEFVDRTLRSRMSESLSALLPSLVCAMVQRHEMVSGRKNRQRWLFHEGDKLLRDDPQEMGSGLHALRFPQLWSLSRDLKLSEEDLRHG